MERVSRLSIVVWIRRVVSFDHARLLQRRQCARDPMTCIERRLQFDFVLLKNGGGGTAERVVTVWLAGWLENYCEVNRMKGAVYQ